MSVAAAVRTDPQVPSDRASASKNPESASEDRHPEAGDPEEDSSRGECKGSASRCQIVNEGALRRPQLSWDRKLEGRKPFNSRVHLLQDRVESDSVYRRLSS